MTNDKGYSGSLDRPPIIVRGDRGKALLLTAGSLIFALFGLGFATEKGRADSGSMWFGAVFFGLCALVGAIQLVFRGRLEISETGFTYTQLGRRHSHDWHSVSGFRVAQMGLNQFVGLDCAGVSGIMPGGWEVSSPELVDILNRAKARWGRKT